MYLQNGPYNSCFKTFNSDKLRILTLEQSLLENIGGMSGLLIFLAEIYTWPRSEKIPLEQHFGIFNGKKQLRQFSHD